MYEVLLLHLIQNSPGIEGSAGANMRGLFIMGSKVASTYLNRGKTYGFSAGFFRERLALSSVQKSAFRLSR